MQLDNDQLPSRYAKAREGFVECVRYNPTLSIDEIGVRWESISTQEHSLSVTFTGLDDKTYVVETKLELVSSDGDVIGWYSLLENENETVLDDYLVFNPELIN